MELNDGVELIFRLSWLIFVIADTCLPRILQQISQIVLMNVNHSLVDPELLESHLKNFSDESKESKKKTTFAQYRVLGSVQQASQLRAGSFPTQELTFEMPFAAGWGVCN